MKQVNFRIFRMILPLLLGLFLSLGAYAQQITVKGHVKDASGEPVIGANVVVKGTTDGTITDIDGNFTLKAPQNSTLTVTFVGYKAIDVKATSSTVVTMQDDSHLLEAVVVIGYGTVKKNDMTGSVTAIKPDELSKGITTNAQDMLAGKVAGVNVTSNDGAPGSGAKIRIRGGASLNASNDPLIVIDGLAIDNDGIKGMSNGLSMVNPADIETFTVLKDASATAIYGSRASNGVIIITTKKGKSGQAPNISYNGSVSLSTVQKRYDVLTGDEYRAYAKKLWGDNLPGELGTENTDWQDQIFRNAISTEHNVSVTGGLKNMPYRVSLGYNNENGIIKTSNFQRVTASVNLAPSFLNDYLKFNINAKYMNGKNRYADAGAALGGALSIDPTHPICSSDEKYKFTGGYWQPSLISAADKVSDPNWKYIPNINTPQNPVAALNLRNDNANSNDFVGSVDMDYKFHFLPDLRFHAGIGGEYAEGSQHLVMSPYSFGNNYYGRDELTTQYKYNISYNMYLQYMKSISSHDIDLMIGGEEQHFHRNGADNVGQGWDPYAKQPKDPNTYAQKAYATQNTLVSYFGRMNYTYLNRYLLTFTMRFDGSSRFEKDHRWGTFPSLALGWKMKEEGFFKDINCLSDLKLRLGWGITGQQDLVNNDFGYMPLYVQSNDFALYPFGDEYYTTSRPKAYNTKLKWEKTTTWNGGLDFGFLNGRINGSVDGYYRETDDLLNSVKIPVGTNFNAQMIKNIGSLKNYGFEFSITGKPIVTKDFSWDLTYNFTWNKNEITKLNGGDSDSYVETGDKISRGNNTKILVNKIGYPANSFYVYQQVYDKDGKPIENMFVDRNGDGIVNNSDKYIYKKPVGDVLMGLTSKMIYKDFDFSFSLRASLDNYVYYDFLSNKANTSTSGLFSNTAFSNVPKEALALGFTGKGDSHMSDYFVRNASFLRCDNITLGYSFANFLKSKGTKGINGRVYTTVQNPFVITEYSGLDPEVKSGIDNNPYPRALRVLLGLSLQF